MAPELVFGTASFGMDMTDFEDDDSVRHVLQELKELGIERLDTGARYPPLNHGRSETLIGEALDLSGSFVVDTKVFTDTRTDGSGDLNREAIQKSVDGSLRRLRRDNGVNVLYAHRADPSTTLEEQIQAFNEQIEKGSCKAWGVSNTPPVVLQNILQMCDEYNWKKPSYYQGPYNIATRGAEDQLLPILRKHGMSFVAYQALAAGFLTGKFSNKQHAGTRFDEKNPLGPLVQRMFNSEDLHNAFRVFEANVKIYDLTSLEVAVRWIAHHSALGEKDAIIIGASKAKQTAETVKLIRKGPLPDEVLPVADNLWNAVRESRINII